MDKFEPPHWDGNVGRTRVIVCAANRYCDVIIPSARHYDHNMGSLIKFMGGRSKLLELCDREEQGFIDQYGDYWNRTDALSIVKLSGQTFNADRNGHDKHLFSEGLY